MVLISSCNSDNIYEKKIKQEIARLKSEIRNDPYGFDVHITSMYDKEDGRINRKDYLWQDMILKPFISMEGDLCFQACFYNYGGDVKLSTKHRRDYFVNLGEIEYIAYIDNLNCLWIKQVFEDEKYGLYSLADWQCGNEYYGSILLTPMAYHAYLTRSGDDNLVYVRFRCEGQYLNVIFRCGAYEQVIVKYYPMSIYEGLCVGSGASTYGKFWHK